MSLVPTHSVQHGGVLAAGCLAAGAAACATGSVITMGGFTRPDGRSYSELRPLTVQLNPLKSGPSCRLTVGSVPRGDGAVASRTSVLAVTYFSVDNKNRNTVGSFHKPTFEVYVRPACGHVKGSLRAMECVLLKTLQRLVRSESLGKALVSVRLQVLEDSGGLLSVCLNAVITCALLAGLQLRSVPHAVPFGVLDRAGSPRFVLDPTSEELGAHCSSGVTLLCEPCTGDVTLTTIDAGSGGFDRSLLREMEDTARRAAHLRLKQIDELYQGSFTASRVSFESNAL